ncbi:hypothetical protein IU451_28975 [Nocardia cyriacigeorgica]|uniref:hypothetical protein n=1 Tax=Nocardia cyriacigeorgica TaxID=135487 RepID=UPI00189522B3|nr:hypothetical protein [Nocardia cyriacigeorgica]MBF6326537.1 hypothetical protein [Nocardia cyriacigeorgica]
MTRFDAVVGIDLSLTSTGVAFIEPRGDVRWTKTITTTGHRDDTWEQRGRRIGRILDEVCCTFIEWGIRGSLVALEAPSYGSTTGSVWDRAGVWWHVYTELIASGHTVLPVAPTVRAKYATGKGTAGKDAVLAAAVRRYADIEITGNDTADAVVLAAIGCRLIGQPIDDPMPALNLTALDKLNLAEAAA